MSFEENGISASAMNMHRAIISLQEELGAIDSYNQRAEMCTDAELKEILIHNRDEEIEHAVMLFESLRRSVPEFDEFMRIFLFSESSITHAEEEATSGTAAAAPGSAANGSLGLGKLRK